MKVFVLILAIAAVARGHKGSPEIAEQHESRSISSNIEDAIKKIQAQMPCGFAKLGIPPLAPLKIQHKEIKTKAFSMDVDGAIDELQVYGLNEFDIVDFKINALTSKMTFNFQWNEAYARTAYDVALNAENSPLFSQMSRKGYAKLTLKDFVIWGTAKYSLGLISGKFKLKEFKMYAKIGDVQSEIENLSSIPFVNRKVNAIVREAVLLAVNDNTENIANLTNDFIVPMVNNIIGDKSLTEIIEIITGKGKGNGRSETTCVPPGA